MSIIGSAWFVVVRSSTWARAAWLRCLARCVIGSVAVLRAVEVGVGVEGWAFRN
jgi:hypothetical protein